MDLFDRNENIVVIILCMLVIGSIKRRQSQRRWWRCRYRKSFRQRRIGPEDRWRCQLRWVWLVALVLAHLLAVILPVRYLIVNCVFFLVSSCFSLAFELGDEYCCRRRCCFIGQRFIIYYNYFKNPFTMAAITAIRINTYNSYNKWLK